MKTIIYIILFLLLIIVIVFLRAKSNGKYEIKIPDIVIAVIPILILFMFSGKIAELKVGDLSVRLKEEFSKKLTQEITLKSNTLLDGKKSFAIGVDCKYKIEEDIINQNPFPGATSYSYITFQNKCETQKDGYTRSEFWGILSFEDYRDYFVSPHSGYNGKVFLSWVKEKNIRQLETLPSFVSVENAVTFKTDKLTALEIMENLNVEFLPVIDDEKLFLGVVTRSKLTSSLLINIGKDLQE